jgi:catechol 2,3-dioxygenase-like lactoylglutathione lyase family enzyme
MLKLDHVALNVQDLQRAVDWYTCRGFIVTYQDSTWAMLQQDDFRLALTIPNQHPPHVAFEVSSLSEMPPGEIKEHRDGSKYLYQKDSEGNTLEFIYWPKSQEDLIKKWEDGFHLP